jgi:hypothetical protein
MGRGGKDGLSLQAFQKMYRDDPFYSWLGLDNPLMYAAHKAAGGMTSVYRQIGIGCEELFRAILQDELGLSSESASWSYLYTGADRRERKLSLDGRIILDEVMDSGKRLRILDWIREACAELGVKRSIARKLQGVVFEVRQGYKSKDSKRQNADLANAATAYTQAYLPCVFLFSTQLDDDLQIRYRNEKWIILTGQLPSATPLQSSYAFMREVIGYDLAGFFQRHRVVLRKEINNVLQALLSAGQV